MLKWLRRISCALFIGFLAVWLGSMLVVEIRTAHYGDQFQDGYLQTRMLPKPDKLYVLSYSESRAKVYYVSDGGGNVLSFVKSRDAWHMFSWDTIWSSSGSASGYIWPYFHHSAESAVSYFLLLLPFFLATVVTLFLAIDRKINQNRPPRQLSAAAPSTAFRSSSDIKLLLYTSDTGDTLRIDTHSRRGLLTVKAAFAAVKDSTVDSVDLTQLSTHDSDGLAALTLCQTDSNTQLHRDPNNHLTWHMNQDDLITTLGLTDGLLASTEPGHQYLSTGTSDITAVLASNE